jgi:hypothetical protein
MEQTPGRPSSLGAAAKPALDDSVEWARAEFDRVSLALRAPDDKPKKKGGKK